MYNYIIYDTINKKSTIWHPTPQDCIDAINSDISINSDNAVNDTYDDIFIKNKNITVISRVNSLNEFYQKIPEYFL